MTHTKRAPRTYNIFLLLSCKILTTSGRNDGAGAEAIDSLSGFASSIHRAMLLRSTTKTVNVVPTNDSIQIKSTTSTRRMNVKSDETKAIHDVDDDYIDDADYDDGEVDTLAYEPQREFKQHDYALKERYVESFNEYQAGNENINVKNAHEVGSLRDTQNITSANDGDDDDEKDKDTESNDSIGDNDLAENKEEALLRHEDPLPERDVVGDSIFFPQSQNDNVFESRQNDEG